MKCEPYYFRPQGVTKLQFTHEDLSPIKAEIDSIMNNKAAALPANDDLAGHIDEEYELLSSRIHISNLISPAIDHYVSTFGFPEYNNNVLTNSRPYHMEKTWVNIQKKNEFNPYHFHGGIFSFVIWLEVPYTREEEEKMFPKKTKDKVNGCFQFMYNNALGYPKLETIFTDKTVEGTGLLFPSMLYHSVYPFYSSDKYRVSVSGNFKFMV